MLVNFMRVCAAREVPEQAPHRGGGWYKPPPVLILAPTVAPSALSAGVLALTHPGRQACGGAVQVPGATAAQLDRLADLSARRMTD